MSSLHNETLEVRQVVNGQPDADGVPTTSAITRGLPCCNIQQAATAESVTSAGARRIETQWTVSCLELAEWLSPNDEIAWPDGPPLLPGQTGDPDGFDYHVEGSPKHFRGGVMDHTEFVIVSTWG